MSREIKNFIMKKLLLGSVFLTIFAFAITIFQISCQKEAVANTELGYDLPRATATTLGGVIVGQGLGVTPDGTLSVTSDSVVQQNKIIYIKRIFNGNGEIWTANYDGSNQQKLNIALPYGSPGELRISPDRQNLFISWYSSSTIKPSPCIYTCKIDGSNLKKIIDDGSDANVEGFDSIVLF